MNPCQIGQIHTLLQPSTTTTTMDIDDDDRNGHRNSDVHPHLCSFGSSSTNGHGSVDDDELENLARYGSVNTNLLDVTQTRHRTNSSSGMSEDKNSVIIERMRRRLQFFFMNPLQKWQTKRQFPYKLTIQVVKVFFVTMQLIMFASYRYANVNYTNDNRITFSHLFLMDWDSTREITSYPPTSGPLAVYTRDRFYKFLDHAINAYSEVENVSIGPYFYTNPDNSMNPMEFCVDQYSTGVIFGFNESFAFDSKTTRNCIEVTPESMTEKKGSFSMENYLNKNNFTISFNSLLGADLRFSLKTVRFRDLGPLKSPDCFRFDISIDFNNGDHDGQTLVSLDTTPHRLICKGSVDYINDNKVERIGRSSVNYIVIGMCTLSLVLCCRAIYRAQLLKSEAVTFFKKYYQQELSANDRLDFLNFWYVMIILNDILIIIGSAVKEQIENKELTGDAWNVCSLLLGIGNLLVWFGVLRYLGFFRTYNVLILTLKRASPNVMRFLLCAMLIYAGFTFCGWLILGPYHMKFSSISTTSECLFALINGDDMFATFAGMSSKSVLLWWFCRFYLYSFISLFIYVVLSLFIALIMDAYETIKLYYTEGFPRSTLQNFVQGPEILNGNNSMYGSTSTAVHPGDTAVGRRTSVAGVLDTIVETICGCSDPHLINKQCSGMRINGENQPLLSA